MNGDHIYIYTYIYMHGDHDTKRMLCTGKCIGIRAYAYGLINNQKLSYNDVYA